MDRPKQFAPDSDVAAGEAAAEIDRLLAQHGQTISDSVAAELRRVRELIAGPIQPGGEHDASREPTSGRATGVDERRYPRISYSEANRPRLVLGAVEYEVTDCSVQGLRLRSYSQPVPAPGSKVKGCVHFCSGSVVTVTGTVLRIEDRCFVIYLEDRLIPASVINAEERFLRMNYPPETYGAPAASASVPVQA